MAAILNKKYIAILLILGTALVCFYPTIDSGVLDLDDTAMILELGDPDHHIHLKSLFWPKDAGRYYRPLLMLSFIMDARIWQLEYSGYHLTNILIHALNAVLLYMIALMYFRDAPRNRSIAFFLGIFFLCHPLAVESVAWISGRTDILSTFFCLLAFGYYLSDWPIKPAAVAVFFLLGLFSKENAACLLWIIPLTAFVQSRKWHHEDKVSSLKHSLKWLFILCIPVILYVWFRFDPSEFMRVNEEIRPAALPAVLTESVAHQSSSMLPGDQFVTFFSAIGFYLKKLFIPFPLSFAISEIDRNFYAALSGVVAISVVILFLRRRFFYPVWVILFILSFAPAIPVALFDIAWMPYAERYLYLSIALLCIFSGEIYQTAVESWPQREKVLSAAAGFLVLILVICGIARIQVWKDKTLLWQDTCQKNPLNGKVLYKYGTVLGPEKGLPFFKKAIEKARDKDWKDFSLLMVAQHEADQSNYADSLELIQQALQINPDRQNCYQAAGILNRIIKTESVAAAPFRTQLIRCYLLAYKNKPRTVDLMNLIKLYEKSNEMDKIEVYVNMLVRKFPRSRAAGYMIQKYDQVIKISK